MHSEEYAPKLCQHFCSIDFLSQYACEEIMASTIIKTGVKKTNIITPTTIGFILIYDRRSDTNPEIMPSIVAMELKMYLCSVLKSG
jgi:hypothetical protein